jgi:hypothetical protein
MHRLFFAGYVCQTFIARQKNSHDFPNGVRRGGCMTSEAKIYNSTLSFNLSAAPDAREMLVSLKDLEGRTILSERRSGDALNVNQQVFPLRLARGGLPSGMYLLTVRIKNEAGKFSTLENKLSLVN